MIAVVSMQPVDTESIRAEFSDDSVDILPVSHANRMFVVDTAGLSEAKREAVDLWVARFGPPRS